MIRTQESFFDEIIVDNFAGGGGASTGIELATGKPVNYAINHDPAAIQMHRTNHPYTVHLCESVWDIDPVVLCCGRPVGLAWFSPDCKHFSRAKGKALVSTGIRGLAWDVLRWAGTVRPRVIILENVEEFQTWGPVRKGRPVKSKSGQTFLKWKKQLEDLGYMIESKVLCAADYGTPTTRRRFYLVARCDGKEIVWPEPTHSRNGGNGKKKWRSAAEIIDWSAPAYSIFASKSEIKERFGVSVVRPLADNTMRRIIRGVDKYTICSEDRYIKGSQSCQLIQYHTEQNERVRASGITEPLPVVDASNRYGFVTANLVEYFKNGRPLCIRDPLHTVTSHDREALIVVNIAEFKGQDTGQKAELPLRTITVGGGQFGAVFSVLSEIEDGGNWPKIRELLNRHCGYQIKDNEILLIEIGGRNYYIRDILLRMLTPRELYNAMGFPEDYIIDRDYRGIAYPRSEQVARCGNAVCPQMAAAIVKANYDGLNKTLKLMSEVSERIAM